MTYNVFSGTLNLTQLTHECVLFMTCALYSTVLRKCLYVSVLCTIFDDFIDAPMQ